MPVHRSCAASVWPEPEMSSSSPSTVNSAVVVMSCGRTHLMLLPADGWAETLAHAGQYFQRLAGASETAIIESSAAVTEKTVSAVTKACTLYIPLGDLVDFEKEIARLSKELDNLHKEIARAEGKLNNPGFVSKAPAALVEQEKGKLALNQQKAEQVEKRIAEYFAFLIFSIIDVMSSSVST